MSWLKGKKTYLVSGLMVLSSTLELVTGEYGNRRVFNQPEFE